MPNENYILLERTELNAAAASVTFANIPQTGYTDLKIVVSTRTNLTDTPVLMYFNTDTTNANYSTRRLFGSGSAASSAAFSAPYVSYADISTYTANTFSNDEIYIPNYTGSAKKSFSVDAVNENNATGADSALTAGLWSGASGTSAITAINFNTVSGSFVAGSTFSLYGIAALGTTPAIAPKASGGNRIDNDGTYWIHTFFTSGTFTPQTDLTCDYLVVAGGGGGGFNYAGGGGAGGLRTNVGGTPLSLISGNTHTVTVGGGGTGATSSGHGGKGSNSSLSGTSITTISATGGGKGLGAIALTVGDGFGGSGGGGTGFTTSADVNSYMLGNQGGYSPAEGNNGGYGANGGTPSYGFGGGGGGGAGSVGGNASSSKQGGTGGSGASNNITGSAVTYAGGGGGGGGEPGGSGGSGGSGGGGTGGFTNGASGVAATANTGSGGGGGAYNNGSGGAGGSGIVIIRYAMA